MSRPQNAAQPVKGKCKLCAQPMELLESGFWVHEGTGYAVHSFMVEAHRKALVA